LICPFLAAARYTGIPFAIYSRRIPELGFFDSWISIDSYGALSFCCREWTRIGFEKSQFLDFVYVLSRTDDINI